MFTSSDRSRFTAKGSDFKVVSDGIVGDTEPFIPDGWTLEDVKAWMSQPRHPAGTSKGGQWSGDE